MKAPNTIVPLALSCTADKTFFASLLFVLVHLGCLTYASFAASPISDEPAHLVAGIHVWRTGNHSLFCVNPPLVKQIAAIPALIVGYRGPDKLFDEYSNTLRTEYRRGRVFIHENGSEGVRLITYGRLLTMLFSLVGYFTVVLWATDLYGSRAGLFAAALWSVSPTILGHVPLLTSDGAGMALGVCAWYWFRRFLVNPGGLQILVLAAVTSLAILAKLTWLLLIPLLGAFVLLEAWGLPWMRLLTADSQGAISSRWVRFRGMAIVFALVYALLQVGYGFDDFGRRLDDIDFHSHALGGHDLSEQTTGNRFRGQWYGQIPVPFCADIVRGLDQQRRDFEHYPASYLNGEFRSTGWWYYYLYAAFFKEPVGFLVLLAMRIAFTALTSYGRIIDREEAFLLCPAIAVGVLVSSQTGMNHHYRYFMPLLPFVLVYVSGLMKSVGPVPRLRFWAGTAMICYAGVSVIGQFPYTIGYFNEFAGGPKHGWKHLDDSSTDWGQGLWALESWMKKHSEADDVVVAAWQLTLDPREFGIPAVPHRPYTMMDSFPALVDRDRPILRKGVYVFSMNVICRKEYQVFHRFPIEESIGGAYVVMRLGKLDADDLNRQRKHWYLLRGAEPPW